MCFITFCSWSFALVEVYGVGKGTENEPCWRHQITVSEVLDNEISYMRLRRVA